MICNLAARLGNSLEMTSLEMTFEVLVFVYFVGVEREVSGCVVMMIVCVCMLIKYYDELIRGFSLLVRQESDKDNSFFLIYE